jgi:hypothetical protein
VQSKSIIKTEVMDGVVDGYLEDRGNTKTIGHCSRDIAQAKEF